MARRNDHTKDEIREMAIISGQNIIKQESIAGFSARKISREIGYTIGTLYNIFENHEDIILNINAKTLDDLKNFIQEKQKCGGESTIKEMAHLYIEFAGKHYNCWNAIFEFHKPLGFIMPEWYENKVSELFEIVEESLKYTLQNKSEIKKHARIIWAGIHGICLLNIKQKLNIDGIKKVETLTDLLINNYLYGAQRN